MANCDETKCNGDCSSCEGDITVTLTLDNDETLECQILTIFPCDGREYIALLPLDENGENNDGEVFIYRYEQTDHGPDLANIEDDDEYDAVADAFDELMDQAEFDEIIDAEDAE